MEGNGPRAVRGEGWIAEHISGGEAALWRVLGRPKGVSCSLNSSAWWLRSGGESPDTHSGLYPQSSCLCRRSLAECGVNKAEGIQGEGRGPPSAVGGVGFWAPSGSARIHGIVPQSLPLHSASGPREGSTTRMSPSSKRQAGSGAWGQSQSLILGGAGVGRKYVCFPPPATML